MEKIFLSDFIEEQEILLLNFKSYWEKQRKLNPDDFPVLLSYADWCEQLAVYLEFCCAS